MSCSVRRDWKIINMREEIHVCIWSTYFWKNPETMTEDGRMPKVIVILKCLSWFQSYSVYNGTVASTGIAVNGTPRFLINYRAKQDRTFFPIRFDYTMSNSLTSPQGVTAGQTNDNYITITDPDFANDVILDDRINKLFGRGRLSYGRLNQFSQNGRKWKPALWRPANKILIEEDPLKAL